MPSSTPPWPARRPGRRSSAGSTPDASELLVGEEADATRRRRAGCPRTASTSPAPGEPAGHADDGDALGRSGVRAGARRAGPRFRGDRPPGSDGRSRLPRRGRARRRVTLKSSNRGSSRPWRSRSRACTCGQQQRVAAEVEEVVRRRRPARRPAPRAQTSASSSSTGVSRRDGTPAAAAPRAPGAGRAWRSTLPLGVSGSASAPRTPTAPCSRAAAAAQEARAARPGGVRRPVRHDVRDEPAAARRPRAPHGRLAHAGMARRAPPRSRRARCGSRGS